MSSPAARRRVLVLTVVAAGVVLTLLLGGTRFVSSDGDDRTNLVVIFTDDQTLESMRVMPRTRELLADDGVEFTEAVANFPLCCPARATLLTGQYAHNHRVLDNTRPDGGYAAFDDTEALPVWLRAAGYQTAHVGKYLNLYGTLPTTRLVPPGWSRWFAPIDPLPRAPGYYEYDVVDNGDIVHYGATEDDYLTDVLRDRAVADLSEMAAADDPFYLELSMLAPHVGLAPGAVIAEFVPAPRHEGTLADEALPASPSFSETDLSDKPQWLQALAAEQAENLRLDLRFRYRAYLESLVAVDELVVAVVDELERSGALEDTLIVFTSDNGFLFGEHGLSDAKNLPYEESIRVPLYVRGPGFDAGTVRAQPVGHIDVVPTLLAAAGVEAPVPVDGEDLHPYAADADHRADRALLVANGGPGSEVEHFEGVRTARWWYGEHGARGAGGIDLYDLRADPYELESLHADPSTAAVRRRYAAALDALIGCVGRACRVSIGSAG